MNYWLRTSINYVNKCFMFYEMNGVAARFIMDMVGKILIFFTWHRLFYVMLELTGKVKNMCILKCHNNKSEYIKI
jgi:hypothetical protein